MVQNGALLCHFRLFSMLDGPDIMHFVPLILLNLNFTQKSTIDCIGPFFTRMPKAYFSTNIDESLVLLVSKNIKM